jgi:hypothetical protein
MDFATLKATLMSAPVLGLLDFNKPFQLQTDASDSGVGAVLMQESHPLAFVSKSLGPHQRIINLLVTIVMPPPQRFCSSYPPILMACRLIPYLVVHSLQRVDLDR